MQTPIRKIGKYAHLKQDPNITEEKFNELKNELEKLKKFVQPRAIEEVTRLAKMGDFSENAAYQMAKGKMRGINSRVLEIEDLLKRANIIKPNRNNGTVQLGNFVTIEINGKTKVYQILGSAETDPSSGIISSNSPIGKTLINKRVGDIARIQLADRVTECRVIKIE